jgi:hypothetical protein
VSLEARAPLLRRLLLAAGAAALAALLLSAFPLPAAGAFRTAGLALLLGAPWLVVLVCLGDAAARRAWGWVAVAAALLAVAALSLL